MTLCAACGAENAASRKFCGECGTPLARACPACGAANEPNVRFCGECGTALEAPAPGTTAPAAPRAAERRLVSVLFADLVGFTTIAEGRDPEEVRELLSRYFDVARTLVGRYGGTIEKFIGDAVMAVWGTPVAREDDAERAVRAALELVDVVASLGEEVGADVRLRAGVATGEAAVTLGAEGQGMVAGDLVNTAARVQSAAEPASVLVNDATRRASSAAIAYADATEHDLKGKAEPMALSRALQVTAARGGALRSTVLEPPFVGREREFRLLKELYHGSADERASRLLTVTGIAGIGKSRLAWEFEKYLDGLAEQMWWQRGRCLAYGDGVAYWALAEMVRMRARISEVDPSHEALAKLRAMLADTVADDGERAWIEPRLAHLIALGDPGSFDRQDLFAAWRLFFERLAQAAPVVLVFEDLQWADAALLDFIEHLLDWSSSQPIFVLALSRPELGERRPGWGSAGRSSTTLSLEPLPERAMRELMERFVPGLPAELVAEILERAQGVPLYAVETVRMLLDRGLLAPTGDRYEVTGEISALEVPETLHALVAARIDDLAPPERAVVQDAAVLGKSFTLAGLSAVHGRSEQELEPVLVSLVRKEVLAVQADPRSPERGQYSFLQDLLRRVAYETLSRGDRRSRHLAAAAYLDAALEGEATEVVAAHYLDAFDAAPDAPDAAEIRAKAADALVRAGRRAASLGASEEAERSLGRAAELVDDIVLRAELEAEAGDAAFAGGRHAAVATRLERAIADFERAGLPRRAARVAGLLGWSMWFDGDLAGGADRIEQALGELVDEEPDEDLAALIEIYARLRLFLGDTDTASERVERALEIAEALGVRDVLIDGLNTKHLILCSRGRVEEGLALIQHAIALGRDGPPTRALTRAVYNMSYQLAAQDRYAEAAANDREGLELVRRRGDRLEEGLFLGHLLYDHMNMGEWDEALALGATLVDQTAARVAIDRAVLVYIHVNRGELAAAREHYSIVERLTDEAEGQMVSMRQLAESQLLLAEGRHADALESGLRGVRAGSEWGASLQHPVSKWGRLAAIDAAFATGDRAVVEELLVELEAAAPVDHTPFMKVIEAFAHARMAALDGNVEEAERLLGEAADGLLAIGHPLERGRVLLELGSVRAAAGRPDAAEPLAEARAIFEGLGAVPWVARVDAVRSPVSV